MTRFKWWIACSYVLLIGLGAICCFALMSEWYLLASLAGLLAIVTFTAGLKAQFEIYDVFMDFVQSTRQRDFTRYYVTKKTSSTKRRIHETFNEINAAFKEITVSKELQYQYLNQIVNMLDTAIFTYYPDKDKVIWMNEAFRVMFDIPYVGKFTSLEKRNKELFRIINNLQPGQQHIEAVSSAKGKVKLLMQLSELVTQEGRCQIVVFQNVNEAIDETETKAWHKLLRVLTHEIMNSIAPISSLAETMSQHLDRLEPAEELEDVRIGVDTIRNRSEGLLKFAKSYRTINKVDKPQLQEIMVSDLFENIYQLLEPTFVQKNIEFDVILKPTRIQLLADANLVEQVLINLVLNAMEAVKDIEKPYITMSAIEKGGNVQIHVSDNGIGIDTELMENIFTPFFTTRKTGSGVGLTLSKQIMLIHGGNILVESAVGKGSTFTLQF
ncbi:sensor histidine kinase [Sphingobacterium spiritivorum]|uniref:sensor histidine kinase n=1 Tax=Sphingobacterium spiritivorum TaxID=258 RepID=UPI003DA682CB